MVLLQGEGVGDVGLVVSQEDGLLGRGELGDEDGAEGWWGGCHGCDDIGRMGSDVDASEEVC